MLISELNSGGFGRIYLAKPDNGEQVVAKLIPKLPGADRELLFENISETQNVIPIIDTGEWDNFYVIIMPKADKSLREYLNECGNIVNAEDVLRIITDISIALAALQGKVVHRDLKPENILLYRGNWCLADFGIARYAEATTSTETWKHAKTWAYAAPERWRGERASSATDIYATGIIAYELISGECPFKGPEESDYRDQHLLQEPRHLECSLPSLATIIIECLFKAPQVRPTAQNVLYRLQHIYQPVSKVAQRLQQINQVATEEKAQMEAFASAVRTEAEHRDILAMSAEKSLNQIMGELKSRVINEISQGTLSEVSPSSWTFRLNKYEIGTREFERVLPSALDSPGYSSPFGVIAVSGIYVEMPTDRYGYEGRSHSLWFCDAVDEGVFRWYETAFMFGVFIGRRGKKNPFGLDPGSDAGRALAPIMGTEVAVAWPFSPIDQGGEEEFFKRWMNWFADAIEGRLGNPSRMPERDPKGSWRPYNR
jgi:serine/threonine-protein kinase